MHKKNSRKCAVSYILCYNHFGDHYGQNFTKTQTIEIAQLRLQHTWCVFHNHMYKQQEMYLYTGKVLLNLTNAQLLTAEESETILSGCLADNRFVVLRPSLTMESGK